MPFYKKGFIQHEKMRDVMAEVMQISYRGPNYIKMKVMWWNTGLSHGPCRAWSIGIKQKIKILARDYDKWYYLKMKDGYVSK